MLKSFFVSFAQFLFLCGVGSSLKLSFFVSFAQFLFCVVLKALPL